MITARVTLRSHKPQALVRFVSCTSIDYPARSGLLVKASVCKIEVPLAVAASRTERRTTNKALNCSNAIWDDGEWVSWDEINEQIQYKEWQARYPNANLSLVPIFEALIDAAQEYYDLTGSYLQVYGDIGELFGAITHGIRLNRNYAKGSDGRLGNDFVEVKTITPFKLRNVVEINLDRNFSKILIVKINAQFEVRGKLIDRKVLTKGAARGKKLRLDWDQFD